jgi:hypothetical protein
VTHGATTAPGTARASGRILCAKEIFIASTPPVGACARVRPIGERRCPQSGIGLPSRQLPHSKENSRWGPRCPPRRPCGVPKPHSLGLFAPEPFVTLVDRDPVRDVLSAGPGLRSSSHSIDFAATTSAEHTDSSARPTAPSMLARIDGYSPCGRGDRRSRHVVLGRPVGALITRE